MPFHAKGGDDTMYTLDPDGFNPEKFWDKKLRFSTKNGSTIGTIHDYGYDYDDDGEQVLEIGVLPDGEDESCGYLIGFDSTEKVKIEVLE